MTFFFFFFNDTATTEIYTLSLHDALPICCKRFGSTTAKIRRSLAVGTSQFTVAVVLRSEEHTSELQSQSNLVCRLLLEKKKKNKHAITTQTEQTCTQLSIHSVNNSVYSCS